MIQVFSKDWFALHQKKLLWFANTSIGRYVLRIHGKRSSVGNRKIKAIIPNAIAWELEDGQIQAEFRVHDKFAKRLYYTFKPVWYFMHFLDWLVLDRFEIAYKYNLGFLTLTAYPASGANSPVDGHIINEQLNAVGWAATIAAADGTSASDTDTAITCKNYNVGGSYRCQRVIVLWDTSALTSSAVISAAVASFWLVTNTAPAAFNVRLCTSTPASDAAVGTADFDQVGSTAQATDYPSSSFTNGAYNDMTLNATGLSNISKTAITKFGIRNVEQDIGGSAPADTQNFNFQCSSADVADTTQDPKFVVTYTIAVPKGGTATMLGI